MNALDISHWKKTAAHSGLIRDHNQQESTLLQAPQRLGNAGQNDDFLRLVEIVAIFNDCPVTIQKYSASHGLKLKAWSVRFKVGSCGAVYTSRGCGCARAWTVGWRRKTISIPSPCSLAA